VYVRPTSPRTQLWWVCAIDDKLRTDEQSGHVFAGDEEAMAQHINELHVKSGSRHAARQIES
jgi:hypothetical protein